MGWIPAAELVDYSFDPGYELFASIDQDRGSGCSVAGGPGRRSALGRDGGKPQKIRRWSSVRMPAPFRGCVLHRIYLFVTDLKA